MNKFIKAITELEPAELETLHNSSFYKEFRNSWKYSEGSEKYYAEYFSDYQNQSFVCFENNAPVALAFIYSKDEVGYFDQPTELIIESPFVSKKALSEIAAHLLKIADGRKINVYSQEQLLYEFLKDSSVKLDYETELIYAVDLSFELDEIKKRFRKSYKSLVNWGLREIVYTIVDQENLSADEFYRLKQFHINTSGKQTRSDESWELQHKMIEYGEAFLINGYLENKLVSSNLFMNGSTSYYGVGVYDRNLMAEMNKGLAHGSLFKAIEYLKKNNSKLLILARWIAGQSMTEKEIQIQDFKRGFTDRIYTRTIIQVRD